MGKRIARIVEMMLAFVFVLMLVGFTATTEKAKADIGYSFLYDGTSQTLTVTFEGSGEQHVDAGFIEYYYSGEPIESIKKLVVNVSPSAVTWEGNITVGGNNTTIIGRFCDYDKTKSLEEVVVNVPGAKISDEAFEHLENLETVDLGSEDSVTELGKTAFCESSLTSITLPDSLTTIKENAFFRCQNLEEIKLPNKIKTIEAETFAGCNSLKKASLSSSLKTIGTSAFAGCPIESIIMPNTMESVGERAFSSCYSLKEVKFSSSLKSIGARAFYDCPIESITLPNVLETIGESAFFRCGEKVLVIPDSVNSIGESAFGANGRLEELYIGKNALNETTGERVFAWCSDLKKVVFSENSECTTIPYGTFLEGKSLTKIEIPASINVIKENAFKNCSSLNTVIFKGETVPEVNVDAFKEADRISMIVVQNKDEHVQDNLSALMDKVITEEEYIAIISKSSSIDISIPVVIDPSLLEEQKDNADAKVEEQTEDKTDEDAAKTDEEPDGKPVKKPKTAKISAINGVRGGFKLTWKKLGKNVKGIQIQYSTSKNFKRGNKTVTVSSKKTAKTIKGLEEGKTYFVRVRTYKLVDGKKVFSKWSAKQSALI